MTLVGYVFGTVLLWSPWHRLTGWMRIACYSGGDLTVTRAASPRSAWVKRTVQVRGEGSQRHVVMWALCARTGGWAGWNQRWPRRVCTDPALILYAADVVCVVKRASCSPFHVLPAAGPLTWSYMIDPIMDQCLFCVTEPPGDAIYLP